MVEAAAGGGGSGSSPGGFFGNWFEGVMDAAQDLVTELTSMQTFKSRVDDLLTQLNDSAAAPSKFGQDRIQRTHLGGSGFQEAEFLYASYSQVHDQLETLSKVLGAQIESMSLAVDVAGKSYTSLDDDIKARMHRLNTEVNMYYDPANDPYAKGPHGSGAGAPHQGGQSGGYTSGGAGS